MNREEAERIAREVVTGTTPSYVGAALRLASFVLSGDDDEIPETVPEPFRKAEEGESLVAPLGDGPPVLSHPAPPGVPEAFTFNTASLPTIGVDGLRPDVHDEAEVGFIPGCDCKKCSDNRFALLRKQEER